MERKQPLSAIDKSLFVAIKNRSLNDVITAISSGANLRVEDNEDSGYNFTPLMLAAYRNRIEIFKYLVEQQQQNPLEQGCFGWCTIHWASEYGYLGLVKYIISKVPDSVHVRTGRGLFWGNETPLILATAKGRTQIVITLIESGADISAEDQRGNTALFASIKFKKPEICQILLAHGANPDKPNSNGNRPTDLLKRCMDDDATKHKHSVSEEYLKIDELFEDYRKSPQDFWDNYFTHHNHSIGDYQEPSGENRCIIC